MPRYGDPDYDPDFDDSPPPTPKYRPPPPPRWHKWYYVIRRNKYLIIFTVLFWYTVHAFNSRRQPIFTPKHSPTLRYKSVDWRLYAYSQYATNTHYLCNSIMLFDSLDRLGSRAERILMYPKHMDTDVQDSKDRDSQLLVIARDDYGARLLPVELESMRNDNWNDPTVKSDLELSNFESVDMSISKFLTFNQTQFARVLHIDSDVTLLKNMDDVFLLPSAPVAMPRAYGRLPQEQTLSPHFILIEPSLMELQRLLEAAEAETRINIDFDRVILDRLYRDSALVLPHRSYGLVSEEFRRTNHVNYHGNDYEEWNPDRALAEASLVHFSDAPLPKPWIMWPIEQLAALQPRCSGLASADKISCRNRELWLGLYSAFRKRRKDLCGLLTAPPPDFRVDTPDQDQEV